MAWSDAAVLITAIVCITFLFSVIAYLDYMARPDS